MRMRVRMFRLHEISKSLGKEPNQQELEVKSLIMEYDKIARKQLVKLKKGKYQRLPTRANIISKFGLKSKERITIDEDINSMIKLYEADMNQLRSNMSSYRLKINEKELHFVDELQKREEVIDLLRTAIKYLKDELED